MTIGNKNACKTIAHAVPYGGFSQIRSHISMVIGNIPEVVEFDQVRYHLKSAKKPSRALMIDCLLSFSRSFNHKTKYGM